MPQRIYRNSRGHSCDGHFKPPSLASKPSLETRIISAGSVKRLVIGDRSATFELFDAVAQVRSGQVFQFRLAASEELYGQRIGKLQHRLLLWICCDLGSLECEAGARCHDDDTERPEDTHD